MTSLKLQEFVLVVRGALNPKIFHPLWFEKSKLLGAGEAEKADLKVVHESFSQFSLEWMTLQVTTDRLVVVTKDEGSEALLLDLLAGMFRLLRHTPITALGINRIVHYITDSVDKWHAIGHKLVPKDEIWNGLLQEPGTRSVTIQGKHPKDQPGSINVRVEPSLRFPNGIYIDVNDHYEVCDSEGKGGSGEELEKLVKASGKNSLKNSKDIIKTLMEKL